MLLAPPGLIPTWPQDLPHWPYLQAIDEALTRRDIPPGTARADHTGRERGERMYMVLAWDVSRTAGPGGIRLHWHEETGYKVGPCDQRRKASGPTDPGEGREKGPGESRGRGDIAGHLLTGTAVAVVAAILEAAGDAAQPSADEDPVLPPDEPGRLSADDEQLVAGDAANTINATLARMLVRLGPPPLGTDGGGLAPCRAMTEDRRGEQWETDACRAAFWG
ncbi:hypothetical protein [Streptomyces adustus]|uniref:hypothetical protein n=1 Tax=Streptomyces adustus TaxID=1609272 RepID=UPI0037181FDA